MALRKFDRIPEDVRPYNTTHQTVSLVAINLQRKSILGMVELTLIPKKPRLRGIKINCKQCRIYKVKVNEAFDAQFEYYDPLLEITAADLPNNQFSLDQFALEHKNAVEECDPDVGGGEVFVRLPSEASHILVEGRPFRLSIEFSLENPQGGLHFVLPDESNTTEKPHMFSCGHANCSRLWFPCIDSYSEVCTWKLEFTVDENLQAVSCGDLVEVTAVSDGGRRKTYHYYVSVPTAAPNIGLAVGSFETYVDPNMHEVTYFCLPGLMSLLRWTSRFMYEIFEFYEEAVGARFPYSGFKSVFVHEAFTEMTSYASMCVMSNSLLHTSAIIDQTYVTRRFLALAVAEQFYSCFISIQHTSDEWLATGISNFLCGLYLKKFFGGNDYGHWIYTELQEVIKYEQRHGGVILDPSALSSSHGSGAGIGSNSNSSSSFRPSPHYVSNPVTTGEGGFYFFLQSPHTVSPEYMRIHAKKAHLVIRMLEFRIGTQLLLQVLNKQLSLASIHIEQMQQTGMVLQPVPQPTALGGTPPPAAPSGPGVTPTNPMLISTQSFTRAVFTVTGKDMTVFMDQWVRQGGHVKFHMSFIFNRKRNTVELELKQEHIHQLGVRKYVGPLTVALQELDGTFKHVLQIEGTHAKADIVCHSKSRRQKKKKIPLCTGEEVDMDLSTMDAESPVLWIRLDPEMTLIRAVDTRQPDFQWQYQMKHERDVTAQLEAIAALEHYPTPQTRAALTDLIENEHVYYKVRCEACNCLAKVANSMVSNWTGPPAMIGIFRKLFGSFSCPQIVKVNDFSNLQHYFIQKTIPVAMASLRNVHGICPADVLRFLFDLFKYNDNSRNSLSDNYYRAALIQALGNTVTPVVSLLHTGANITVESLSADARAIMEEISKCLNLEKVLQCYKYTVSVECLRALRKLQKFGHLPNKIDLFRTYTLYGHFYDVRLAAFEAIVDYTITDGNIDDVHFLLDVVENDPVPAIRYDVCRLLVQALARDGGDHRRRPKTPLHCAAVAKRLWHKFNNEASVDSRHRAGLVDLYFTLFGSGRPLCLLSEEQAALREDVQSRRKSQITTREGVEEQIHDEDAMELESELTEAPTSAKVLSIKRQSMADSDDSQELPPSVLDLREPSLPTSFEPGMFSSSREGSQESIGKSEVKSESSSHKKHHHHHSKAKKKKEKKKKHKHRRKHKPSSSAPPLDE